MLRRPWVVERQHATTVLEDGVLEPEHRRRRVRQPERLAHAAGGSPLVVVADDREVARRRVVVRDAGLMVVYDGVDDVERTVCERGVAIAAAEHRRAQEAAVAAAPVDDAVGVIRRARVRAGVRRGEARMLEGRVLDRPVVRAAPHVERFVDAPRDAHVIEHEQ
jgi:hypothetical protein